MKILGLGNALVDVLSKLESDETLVKIGIQKGAMDMIPREQMYVIRKYQANTETTQAPGGANCNTMRAIALLGGQSGFIGKVGDDNLGQFYEEALLKAGVASYLIKTEGPSGACTVFISPDGERTMGTFLGPAPTISPDEITEDVLRGYDCIHIEGYLIVNEELVRETMKKATCTCFSKALTASCAGSPVNASASLALAKRISTYCGITSSNNPL